MHIIKNNKIEILNLKKEKKKKHKIRRLLRELSFRPEDPSLIPGAHRGEGENWHPRVVLGSLQTCPGMSMTPDTP